MPGRAVVDRLPDGTEHRTSIWISNSKTSRDKLACEQLRALMRPRHRLGTTGEAAEIAWSLQAIL